MERPDGVIRRASVDDAQRIVRPHNAAAAADAARMASAAAACRARRCRSSGRPAPTRWRSTHGAPCAAPSSGPSERGAAAAPPAALRMRGMRGGRGEVSVKYQRNIIELSSNYH
jgi:hypothetical protein